MYRTLALLATLSATISIFSPVAEAAENGPVNITVNATSYKVFYSTIAYSAIEQNYINQNSAFPNAIYKAPTTTTAYPPYFVAGTNTIPGLGSYKGMMQPWWNASSSSTAQAAALAWYNKTGWPINDGVQFPNETATVTPLFAYAYNDAGTNVKWVAYNSSGALLSGENDLSETGHSYALAGISQ